VPLSHIPSLRLRSAGERKNIQGRHLGQRFNVLRYQLMSAMILLMICRLDFRVAEKLLRIICKHRIYVGIYRKEVSFSTVDIT